MGIKVNIYYDRANDAYEIHIGRNLTNLSLFETIAGFRYSMVARGRYRGMTKKNLFRKSVLRGGR